MRDDGLVEVDLTATVGGQTVLAKARAVVRLAADVTLRRPLSRRRHVVPGRACWRSRAAAVHRTHDAGAVQARARRTVRRRRRRADRPPSVPRHRRARRRNSGGDCPRHTTRPGPEAPADDRWQFTVSADLSTVQGIEHISFTPDMPITELVFRLTANTAPTVAAGQQDRRHTPRTADHGGGTARSPRDAADASTQGGLLHIPFAPGSPAGTTVTADLTFTLTLGERVVRPVRTRRRGPSRYAWFAPGAAAAGLGARLRLAHRGP